MVKRSTIRGNIITAGSSRDNNAGTDNQTQSMEGTSTNLVQLLNKISLQLDGLATDKLPSGSDKTTNTNEQNNEGKISQELQSLFSDILAQQKDQESLPKPTAPLVTKNVAESKAHVVQTAAQILSEAQYELANELDASLKKLQKVIKESEKIAQDIGKILGKKANNDDE